jgi:hypothetical protein
MPAGAPTVSAQTCMFRGQWLWRFAGSTSATSTPIHPAARRDVGSNAADAIATTSFCTGLVSASRTT